MLEGSVVIMTSPLMNSIEHEMFINDICVGKIFYHMTSPLMNSIEHNMFINDICVGKIFYHMTSPL